MDQIGIVGLLDQAHIKGRENVRINIKHRVCRVGLLHFSFTLLFQSKVNFIISNQFRIEGRLTHSEADWGTAKINPCVLSLSLLHFICKLLNSSIVRSIRLVKPFDNHLKKVLLSWSQSIRLWLDLKINKTIQNSKRNWLHTRCSIICLNCIFVYFVIGNRLHFYCSIQVIVVKSILINLFSLS